MLVDRIPDRAASWDVLLSARESILGWRCGAHALSESWSGDVRLA